MTIDGGAGNDYVANGGYYYNGYYSDVYGNNVTIDGGAGNDSIKNLGDIVKIYGGEADDTIINVGYDEDEEDYGEAFGGGFKVTIDGGAGNDSIVNQVYSDYDYESNEAEVYGAEYASILGGTGNDSIYNEGDSTTISGGTGNDYMKLSYYVDIYDDDYFEGGDGYEYREAKNVVIQYASGDGNDTISGFNSDDILQITKGSYKAKVSGNDVIVTVGKGKILLKDAAGKEISIKNSKGKVTTKTYGSSALFAENNFVTADNLSEIVENNSAVSEIQTQNLDSLTQENLITFSEK